jgi:hypothetical protein
MILHLEYGMNGQDKIGWSFCYQAVSTAQQMGLFGPPREGMKQALKVIEATTSWGLFAWQA